ncbi:sulfate adenylyltransferase subunit CysD [Neptunomonas sp.]|uniref:sulfate adenylyltransferase subunit CysD n=1 Tax=Neptunomonas sp. TaxID=1971898 RepID=UPI0035659578
MKGSTQTATSMTELRKLAVSLRLQKASLNEIQQQTNLSHPTIIAAYKKFLRGGWKALQPATRGRPSGAKRLNTDDLHTLHDSLLAKSSGTKAQIWDVGQTQDWLQTHFEQTLSIKSVRRYLHDMGLIPGDEPGYLNRTAIHDCLSKQNPEFIKKKPTLLICGYRTLHRSANKPAYQIYCRDMKHKLQWQYKEGSLSLTALLDFLDALLASSAKPLAIALKLPTPERFDALSLWQTKHKETVRLIDYADLIDTSQRNDLADTKTHTEPHTQIPTITPTQTTSGKDMPLTHLQRLEAESIQIMREVVAETENPVMLYSIGKDSAVMLHIAMKAFYPSLPPFPLLHVDTRWKFREMYTFRDKMVKNLGLKLITHINPEGVAKNINPFTHGSAIHTDIMKTEGLKQALNEYGFDAAFGGARRDEEKSRAKERIFSFRTADHRWDPKNQRPEIWKQYNARKNPGESIRVFPISNWTELDIWQYIHLENIPIVPLYYSAERPVVERDGTLIMVDDERMPLLDGEIPMMKKVRFRTLGCYPLTGAVESEADTLPAIIQEMLLTTTSERQGRMIDHDSAASMEKKKQEGYF